MLSFAKKFYLFIAPLPIIANAGLFLYGSFLEGWGVYGIVGWYNQIILISLILGAIGIVLVVWARREKQPVLWLIMATIACGLPGVFGVIPYLDPAFMEFVIHLSGLF